MRATLQKTENGYGLKEMVAFVSSARPEHKHHKLSLKNCQAIELGYDLDELSCKMYPVKVVEIDKTFNIDGNVLTRKGFIAGFHKALEMFGDKKFSEGDVRKAIEFDKYHYEYGVITSCKKDDEKEEFIQSLQQTEWDVTVEMGYKRLNSDGCEIGFPDMSKPKLDADGCLILRRV